MVYYIIPFFFPLFYLLRSRIFLSISIYTSLLLMLLFAGLRWETGTDWIPYYDDFISPNIRQDFELGYVTYVNIIRWFTESYTVFLLITTFIPLFLIYTTINKCIDNKRIVLLSLSYFYAYYFLGSFFGAERRIIAIGLCFYAIGCLIKSKKLYALLSISLATLFHSSAAIAVLMFFVQKIRINYLFWLMLSLVMIIVPLTAYADGLVYTLISYIPIDIIRHKLTVYTENAEHYGEFNIFGLVKRVLICFLIYFCIMRTYLKNDPALIFLLKIYILGVILYTILTPVSAMFSVLTIYFTITEVLLIPILITRLKIIENAVFFIVIYILYLCYQTYSILNSYPDLFYPYISIFSGINRVGIY